MNTDLTFITNEKDRNLLERFRVLIKDTGFFDVLVGYFFTSGFYALYKSLEKTEKIRILIGISTNRETSRLIENAESKDSEYSSSHAEVKQVFEESVAEEMEHSEDNPNIEEGVHKFIEWIKNKKLEIKAYPTENLHAKLYIMTFRKGDRDVGRVITGSSNFTQAGLRDNLEFNVELKTRTDYEYALNKFNELWKNAVDVSEKYVESIQHRTWLNNAISPYELYLKFLYEYFREKINIDQEGIYQKYLPENFLNLEYQLEAVKDAKGKLEEYGGVFVSDVVGLGKTYISAMLAQQLNGRNLVIAPPALLDENNLGSWPNVFQDFHVPAKFESLGKLDELIRQGTDKYKNVFIDEAHRFRTETTMTYETLAQICRGKRVVLVSATPLNNSPRDILSQIKLFQKAKNSTVPGVRDLEAFFGSLIRKLKGLDRQKDYKKYIQTVRENAREIREKVLKILMVRRTRAEINKYFADDLKKQGLRFPDVHDPEPIFYELNKHEDGVFTQTIESITKRFKYARYTPMLYYEGEITQPEELAQINMGRFMKILLVKRLESSFFAFKQTLSRFIKSYEQFIHEFDKGNVYVSKKYTNKVFEFLENDDEEAIQRLIDEEKARKYPASEFRKDFRQDLQDDLKILREVKKRWDTIQRDPKLLKFINVLSSKELLKKNKLILFTESKETVEYLERNLQKKFGSEVLSFSGGSSAAVREKVIENFDARARYPKDDYRVLLSTEVLAEGVNLHRSNVVINYDIPWNPARMIQRVGRVNRVDTKFKEIYTFNFFPTIQGNNQIKLREAAEAKIEAFIEMLGADAKLLTEGEEIKSHDLFTRLTSKKTITGEDESDESELQYLQVIRSVRDKDPDLFERIKRLPKKARSAKARKSHKDSVLTYFRKSKMQKFYASEGDVSNELDFFTAAKMLESQPTTKREKLGQDFYQLLEKNKKQFVLATTEESTEPQKGGRGRDSAIQLLKILKAIRRVKEFTDEDELYIARLINLIEEGGLPRQTVKTLIKKLEKEANPLKLLAVFRTIPPEFLKPMPAENSAQTSGPREVILSEYLVSE